MVPLLAAALAVGATAAPARASWPGSNGIIAYDSSTNEGDTFIFTSNADGTNPQQLTHAGSVSFDPSFSPNGKKIAYDGATEEFDGFSIWVMRSDGTHRKRLGPDENCNAFPTWSPNGKKIVFIHYPDPDCEGPPDIWIMRNDGGGARPLTNTPGVRELDPKFSPDGKRILFVAHTPGTFALSTIDKHGGDRRQITPSNLAAAWGDWSPDGSRIAFANNANRPDSDVFIANADGTNIRKVAGGPGEDTTSPRWSPDGTKLLFASDRNDGQLDLYTLNLSSSAVTRVTNTPDAFEFASSWQPIKH
jgi:TolB protein